MSNLEIPQQPSGIYFGVLPNISGDWLAAQKNLTIVLKDGYGFFKANRDVFAARLADPNKATTILINNPDTPYLEAITEKDFNKTAETQRNDYMQTVLLIQAIGADVTAQTGDEPNDQFLGFDGLPTENIFLGDHEAIKKFYPSESYRGPLEGVMIDAEKSDAAREVFNRAAETCAVLADGKPVVTVNKEEKLLPAARSLWEYEVPQKYRTQDFRR